MQHPPPERGRQSGRGSETDYQVPFAITLGPPLTLTVKSAASLKEILKHYMHENGLMSRIILKVYLSRYSVCLSVKLGDCFLCLASISPAPAGEAFRSSKRLSGLALPIRLLGIACWQSSMRDWLAISSLGGRQVKE
jgi:hypothetical protein